MCLLSERGVPSSSLERGDRPQHDGLPPAYFLFLIPTPLFAMLGIPPAGLSTLPQDDTHQGRTPQSNQSGRIE